MQNPLKKIVAMTFVAWLIGTAGYAYYYVHSRLNLSGLEGYETDWDWQLLFFGLVRLPFLLIGLAVAIWLEFRYFPKDQSNGKS